MPEVVFACSECGSSEVARPMAEASSRTCCPTCQGEARRCGGRWRQRRLARTNRASWPGSAAVRCGSARRRCRRGWCI